MGDRRPFVAWFTSQPDPERSPRTTANTQDEFTVALPRPWDLAGTWSVRVLDCSMAEVRPESSRRDLMLYSDVMVYEIVGHDRFPLLDWLPYNSNEYLRHQQSRTPFRRRVASTRLESISFKVVDVTGRVPKFRTLVPTLVCLEFEPQDATFDASSMECTFLSNQSRNLHPDNAPHRFTAQLPAVQRMDRGRWEVGIVKLTLPPVTLVTKGDWRMFVKFQGRSLSTQVQVTERPETIEALVEILNRRLRENVKTTYLTAKIRGFDGSLRQRRIVSKNATFPPFLVGDQLTVYSPRELVRAIRDGTGLGLRWARTWQGKREVWNLYLDSPNGDTVLDVTGTFLKRLGFTEDDVDKWSGPLIDGHETEYYVKASDVPFTGETITTMVGVAFAWNPSTRRVTLETGFRDQKMTGLDVGLSEDLAKLFGLESRLKRMTRKGTLWYSLNNCLPEHVPGCDAARRHHVPLPDALEGWKKAGYRMFNVEGVEEVVYDFHHDGTRSRGYVSCNLLDPVMLGDRVVSLMESIPLQTTLFASRGSVRPGGYVYEPQHVKYHPLSTTTFQSVEFAVEDERGRPLPLDPEGVTTVSVKFRQKP